MQLMAQNYALFTRGATSTFNFKIYATYTRTGVDNDYFEISPINLFIFVFIAQTMRIFHFIFGQTKQDAIF